MGGMIKGIIIEKSNFSKNTPVEECEKEDKDGYIVRFQRLADVSLSEKFVRFFSDIFDGVTKAKDAMLCNLEGNLPPFVSIKGHTIIIKDQKEKSAEGWLQDYNKHLPVGAENISIFLRAPEQDPAASQATSQTNDVLPLPSNGTRVAPAPPSTDGLPPLSTTQQGPIANLAPPLPSREGHPELTSANKSVNEPVAQGNPPVFSAPADYAPPTLPENYQQTATTENELTSSPMRAKVDENKNPSKKTILDQIKEGIPLRKTTENARPEPTAPLKSSIDTDYNMDLLNRVKSMRKAIEGNDKKDDEDWS